MTSATQNLPSDVNDIVLHLNTVAKEHIKDIYNGNDIYAATVENLCESISTVVKYCATLTSLPNDEHATKFFKRTLPVLIDVLLRRKTKLYV